MMNMICRIAFMLLMLLCNTQIVKAQPSETPNIKYYHQFIQTNYDKASALKHIATLRSKLTDTLYVAQKSKDTLWLKAHKEALYLNFLCYNQQSAILNHDLCLKQLAIQNYQYFYRFKDLDGFPQKQDYELAYAQVKHMQRRRCVDIYLQYNSNLKEMPSWACGCRGVLKELMEEEEQNAMLIARAASMRKAEEAKKIQRQKEIQDSIKWINERIKYEPIYLMNGKLRSDSAITIKSANLDSLNIFLVREMLRASNEVFNFYVNNCAGENIERMIDVLEVQKFAPVTWYIKLKKTNGILTLTDNIPINGPSNKMLLKLISELYLNNIARFIDENEVLVIPFRCYRNGNHTDNRTVEYNIENGFLNIILPVIITDRKQLVPYMSPEEYERSEFEKERTRE